MKPSLASAVLAIYLKMVFLFRTGSLPLFLIAGYAAKATVFRGATTRVTGNGDPAEEMPSCVELFVVLP